MGPINKYEELINGELEVEELLKPISELLQRIITVVEPIKNKVQISVCTGKMW